MVAVAAAETVVVVAVTETLAEAAMDMAVQYNNRCTGEVKGTCSSKVEEITMLTGQKESFEGQELAVVPCFSLIFLLG